ncbi:MAG: hypothetical protein HY600_03905 [Candidatus Omnitrophica bacterium]|nr:hypothetical protein [Candidatus Omnitrophota bacterium]
MRWLGVVMAVVLGTPWGAGASVWAAGSADEAPHAHQMEAAAVVTEDAVLKEQIAKVDEALATIHEQMAVRRQALQQAMTEGQKASLYAELDGLRKEHDLLERLLHELLDEARATEWTAIDAALARVKSYERVQERATRREEALRDRKE